MNNLLLEEVEYKVEKTLSGEWRRYMYPTGESFGEYKSMFGVPLIHYTYGKSPEAGRRVVAKGILALGHVSFGAIAIGQLGLGLLFGLGQAASGIVAVGQLAIGLAFGLGQFAVGKYVLAQLGLGKFMWSPKYADPVAVEFFRSLWQR